MIPVVVLMAHNIHAGRHVNVRIDVDMMTGARKRSTAKSSNESNNCDEKYNF